MMLGRKKPQVIVNTEQKLELWKAAAYSAVEPTTWLWSYSVTSPKELNTILSINLYIRTLCITKKNSNKNDAENRQYHKTKLS